MNKSKKFTVVRLVLPSGHLVLQRRTKDAPYAPGALGFFGGWVEQGETPDECIARELQEETSISLGSINLGFVKDIVIPASKDFNEDRHFYIYDAKLENLDFEVYEGDGAEAFTLETLKTRKDLASSAKYIIDHAL